MKRLGLLALGLLASCAAPITPAVKHYDLMTHYNDADFSHFAGKGPGVVSGQGFMKTVGGDVKTCAGAEVAIMPANAYTQELVKDIGIFHSEPANVDLRMNAYSRKSICDAQGSFRFADLPTGDWFVVTEVKWGVPGQFGVELQGGELVKRVTVGVGEQRAILTDADLVD